MKAEFTWTAVREGNIGVIEEHRPDGTIGRWRIPAFLVPAFLRARRALMHHKMATQMSAKPIQPDHDYTYLEPPDGTDDHIQPAYSRSDPRDPRNWGTED